MQPRKTVACVLARVLMVTLGCAALAVPAIADGAKQLQCSPVVSAIADGAKGQNSVAMTLPLPAQHDRIDALDSQFISLYESARGDFLGHGDPIILFHRGSVTLINHGKVVTKIDYMPQQFQTLKTVDHVILGSFIALADHPDRLTEERLGQLKDFLAATIAARSQIEHAGLSQNQEDRQGRIIDASVVFLTQVIEKKGCSRSLLDSYIQGIRQANDDNISDAVGMDLSNLNDAVTKLLGMLSQDETRALKIVMFGSHMARIEESHWQYFSRLLDEPVEGHRIVYFEGNGEDKDGIALLGAHMIDEQIGLEYFGSSWRMHRDLLSAAASRWLDEHPVKAPAEREKFWSAKD